MCEWTDRRRGCVGIEWKVSFFFHSTFLTFIRSSNHPGPILYFTEVWMPFICFLSTDFNNVSFFCNTLIQFYIRLWCMLSLAAFSQTFQCLRSAAKNEHDDMTEKKNWIEKVSRRQNVQARQNRRRRHRRDGLDDVKRRHIITYHYVLCSLANMRVTFFRCFRTSCSFYFLFHFHVNKDR